MTNTRCPDYDFLYTRWAMACTLSETDALEAKAALQAHASECKICAQAIIEALAASKPLPRIEVDHV
jgi:hypothetical protein